MTAAELPGGARLHTLKIPLDAPAVRLDRYVTDCLADLSRARVQALLAQGEVQVDGVRAKPSQRIKPGQTVTLREPPPEPAEAQPQDLPLTILFQDDHLVVLDKAAGVVVHPAAGNPDGTLVNALLHHVGHLPPVGGATRPGIVHRLDKDTSGVLVVAKGDQALRQLQQEFKEGRAHKRYLALCRGVPRPDAGTFRTPYGRHPTARVKFTSRSGLRTAVTDYRVLHSAHGASAVELVLHTGRTHQIRVHLSEHGHPILGDTLYGGRQAPELPEERGVAPRQMLHAALLELGHPASGERIRWRAPLPADLVAAADALDLGTAVRAWWAGLLEPPPGTLRTRTSAGPVGNPRRR